MNRFSKLLLIAVLLIVSIAPFGSALAQEDSLLVWADATRAPTILALGELFAEEYGVTVEVQEMGLGDIRDQLQVAGPAGEGPDIIVGVHDTLGQLVANGMLLPIELGDLAEEFLPSALDAWTLGDVLYGVPYGTENIAFIRNPDLVTEQPTTWADVMAVSAELEEAGTVRYGFLVQTGNTYHTFPITSAFGGYIFGFDEEGNYDVSDIGFASEGGIASAQWLQAMVEAGHLVPDVDDDVVLELYTAGELGMFITGPWWLDRIRETGQPYVIEGFPGVEGVTESGRPFSGVQGFAISAFTEQELLAETFVLDYLATEEAMQMLYDEGLRPSAWLSVREAIDDPDIASFAAVGVEAIPMPSIPEMSAVWAASGSALNLIIQGQLDGETAYLDAAAQIATTIAEARALAEAGEIVVGVPGSWQAAVGCPGDWQPECEVTFLTLNEETGLYEGTFDVPAGEYEYKVALNLTWDENYGADGERDGANLALVLEADSVVTFTYDAETHIITHEIGE